MRFTNKKVYSATVYDANDRFVYNTCGLRFESKANVLKWARFVARKFKTTFGHISVCDDKTSQIVRYTPSGKICG